METGVAIGYLVGVLLFGAASIIGLSYLGFFVISYNLLLYCLYSVFIGLGPSIYLFNNDQTTTGLVYFILALGILIFFGLRWFSSESVFNPPTTFTWPPFVNTCPDFLYFYKRRGEDTCVDPIGVSKNGAIQKLPPGPINDDNNNYFFKLETSSRGADAIQSELCRRAIANGLTWEGVTDGSVCITRQYGTTYVSSASDKKCE